MDHDPLQGFFDECETCWTQFEAYTVSQITDQLWPATVVTASLSLFVVALVVTVRWPLLSRCFSACLCISY